MVDDALETSVTADQPEGSTHPDARPDDGQGLAEYALILALIAIVAIVALLFLGGAISQILSTVGHSL
jgi:pilus assembly protein Flp/PilA